MNNVKMRSTNNDGQTVEVRDHSVKIPTMFETRVMPKFKVLVAGKEIAETENFQQAKFIFKNQL